MEVVIKKYCFLILYYEEQEMYNFKRLEDLTFTDDFMFSQVMKNKEMEHCNVKCNKRLHMVILNPSIF